MRKYRFIITELVPISQGGNREIFKVDFFADSMDKAEQFGKEIEEVYLKTKTAYRPASPFPSNSETIDITDEPKPYTLGESKW